MPGWTTQGDALIRTGVGLVWGAGSPKQYYGRCLLDRLIKEDPIKVGPFLSSQKAIEAVEARFAELVKKLPMRQQKTLLRRLT